MQRRHVVKRVWCTATTSQACLRLGKKDFCSYLNNPITWPCALFALNFIFPFWEMDEDLSLRSYKAKFKLLKGLDSPKTKAGCKGNIQFLMAMMRMSLL